MALGEILMQTRLAKHLTKEDIARQVQLMTRHIDALEREDFSRFPAPVYAKGMLKLYCKALELDPKPLLEDYERLTSTKGSREAKLPVTHPAVADIPDKPIEPIHTGAHRVLPVAGEGRPEVTNSQATTHRFVESAAATFTSVPVPECRPQVVEQDDDIVAPELDELASPAADLYVSPAAPPVPVTKTRRDVTQEARRAHALGAKPGAGTIFAPQHSLDEQEGPLPHRLRSYFAPLAALFKKEKEVGFAHSQDAQNWRAAIIKLLWILGVLVVLTLIILGFHYVSKAVERVSPEAKAAGSTLGTNYSPDAAGIPPMNYIK